MDKPEDIPQDVWDLALRSTADACTPLGAIWGEEQGAPIIARAILKAKNDALEEAANVAMTAGSKYYAETHPGHTRVPVELERFIAQAIRNLKHEG